MVRSFAFRVVLSAVAGVVSFYVVAALTLLFGHERFSPYDRYQDAFGLATVAGRLVDPYYHPREELGSAVAYRVADVAALSFWSILFALLFYWFLFRVRPTI
jgi:hypothetical protein